MKALKYKISVAALIIIAAVYGLFAFAFTDSVNAKAETFSAWVDGSYGVTYEVGGTSMPSMVTSRFDSTIVVDKVGENYFMSFSQIDGISSMQNLTLILDGNDDGKKVGQEIIEESESRKTYRYTLSAENLASTLNFSVYITAMGSTQSFTVTLDLEDASYIGEVDMSADRPAQYVPVITTSAGSEYEVETGAAFAIPAAAATLGGEQCEVTYAVYYVGENGDETIELNGAGFTVEKAGEYRLVYTASSSTYKTMLGNDTCSEYEVSITSTAAATSVAYFEDTDGVLTESAVMQASKISSGAVYDTAAEKMAKVSDNFEVYSVLIYNGGEEVTLSGDISIYISTSLNPSKAVVYYMDGDGNITKLSTSSNDGYVMVTTDETGTFIVCIPGVAMSKMTKMIILAVVLLVVIVAVAVTIPVVIHKKRKKKRFLGN